MAQWETAIKVFEHVDQVFFDLKAFDSQKHRELTGMPNEIIMRNATNLAKLQKHIVFRIPLIPGCNDDEENITATAQFVAELQKYNDNISLEILPYHNFGESKYQWLNKEYTIAGVEKPTADAVDEYKKMLSEICKNVI